MLAGSQEESATKPNTSLPSSSVSGPARTTFPRTFRQGQRTTIREAFDRYRTQRVNVSGQQMTTTWLPGASAEWVKHNLNPRFATACRTASAAKPHSRLPTPRHYTCPDFQTTPGFLQIHRRQATANSRLIEQAEGNGQLRLAENHAGSTN